MNCTARISAQVHAGSAVALLATLGFVAISVSIATADAPSTSLRARGVFVAYDADAETVSVRERGVVRAYALLAAGDCRLIGCLSWFHAHPPFDLGAGGLATPCQSRHLGARRIGVGLGELCQDLAVVHPSPPLWIAREPGVALCAPGRSAACRSLFIARADRCLAAGTLQPNTIETSARVRCSYARRRSTSWSFGLSLPSAASSRSWSALRTTTSSGTGIGIAGLTTELGVQRTAPPVRTPSAADLVAGDGIEPGKGFISLRYVSDLSPSHDKNLRCGIVCVVWRETAMAIPAHRLVMLGKDLIESSAVGSVRCHVSPRIGVSHIAYVRIVPVGYTK